MGAHAELQAWRSSSSKWTAGASEAFGPRTGFAFPGGKNPAAREPVLGVGVSVPQTRPSSCSRCG